MDNPPQLSIVATARNDNHGGNLLHRMQIFVNGILAQSQQHQFQVELILVEWNPPADKPRLARVLAWPRQHDFGTVRIIAVPPKIHQRYQYAANLPLYQMIAKNVGIRRATAPFVLVTNIDILFSEEIFAFFASKQLMKGKIYRVDRYDIPENLPVELPFIQQLEYCRNNVIRINGKEGTRNLLTGDYHVVAQSLHTNAAGDFQLMAREDWDKLRGYPEFDTYSFHLDSVLAFMAYYSRIQEEILPDPLRIYHLEHQSGWTPETEKKNILWDKLATAKIPRLTNADLENLVVQMRNAKPPIFFNDDNWGLVRESLPEEFVIKRTSTTHKTNSLSIVVTSRNDTHGGNLLHRMQVFINGLVYQCRKFKLPAELIIVEWNPDPDREKLVEVLQWPAPLAPLTVRFIEVPPEIHKRLGNSDKFPLFQMIAKNVGIRRARGEFILATNIDLLFSDELMWFLAHYPLVPTCFYRVDRYDVGCQEIPLDLSVEEQLAFCQKNLIRIQGRQGTVTLAAGWPAPAMKKEEFFSKSPSELTQFLKSGEGHALHTNACGDFTLLARDRWLAMRGYPELPLWSIYVDGLLMHMAQAVGLRQVILPDPLRIYHIEHEMGWAVISHTMHERPSLDYQKDYLPWCQRMQQERQVLTPNDENWGLVKEELTEYMLAMASSGSRPEAKLDEHTFRDWLAKLAVAQHRLYLRDQTPESLMNLVELVYRYQPTKIIELGTLAGLSLRTWIACDSSADLVAIDLSFSSLYQSQAILPLDLSKVKLLEQDILQTDFRQLWSSQDKVLFYVDAHDEPQVPIMDYVLQEALPKLPAGSVVVIDDVWYSSTSLSKENVQQFFEKVVLNEIDPLQCFQGYYASYWLGGSFLGFREVIPLLKWVNQQRVKLDFKPGIKSVSFPWPFRS